MKKRKEIAVSLTTLHSGFLCSSTAVQLMEWRSTRVCSQGGALRWLFWLNHPVNGRKIKWQKDQGTTICLFLFHSPWRIYCSVDTLFAKTFSSSSEIHAWNSLNSRVASDLREELKGVFYAMAIKMSAFHVVLSPLQLNRVNGSPKL